MTMYGKRTVQIITAAVVLLCLLSACSAPGATSTPAPDNPEPTNQAAVAGTVQPSSDAGGFHKEGYPIVDEPIKLRIVNRQTPVQKDFNEIVILKNFEEKSGVQVEWINVPAEFVAERRNIMMTAAQDLPDVFFKMSFTAAEVQKYAKQGLFIPLDDLIEVYAPNVKAAFEQWPDVRIGLTMPDGHIYSLSYILGAPPITNGVNLFFNKEALDQVGMDVPKTTDELETVLRAFKELDYNGNGEADEVPMTTSDGNVLETIFYGSFGLGTRGGSHSYVDIDPATNQPRFFIGTENYKQLLQYMNKLYADGLIDRELFTMDMPKLIAKGEEGRALSYIFVNHSVIGTHYSEKSIGLQEPLTGPNGDKFWRNGSSALSGVGNMIITKANKYPEITMRWADYWYSDEGVRDYFMGIENETYYIDSDGEYQYTDFVMKNPNGIMFEQVLGAYVPWAGGANPSIASSKYFKGGEMQPISRQSAEALFPYRTEIIWPSFVWNEEDIDDMVSISADLDTYIKENRALFITGKRSFDEWDAFVKGLESMRVDRYMEIYQNALTRYGLK